MAINVQYGPISAGLGLAQAAGKGIQANNQQQQDMAFLKMVQDLKAQEDAKQARSISTALGAEQQSVQNEQDAAKFNAQQANSQQQQEADNQFRQQQAKFQAANTATAQRYAAEDQQMQIAKFNSTNEAQKAKDAAIGQLTPREQAVVNATGHMPFVPSGGVEGKGDMEQIRLWQGEAKRLEAIVSTYEAMKAKTVQGMLGRPVPDPPQVAAARAALQQTNDNLQQVFSGNVDVSTLLRLRANSGQGANNTGAQPGQPGQPAPSGGTPTVSSAQEYAQLPVGAAYIWAGDGKRYVKGQK